jgi:hypothetical protein
MIPRVKALHSACSQMIPINVDKRQMIPAHTFLQMLTTEPISSATAGSGVPMSAFWAAAFRELGVALLRGNKAVYRGAISVSATAGGTAATPGAATPTACCMMAYMLSMVPVRLP